MFLSSTVESRLKNDLFKEVYAQVNLMRIRIPFLKCEEEWVEILQCILKDLEKNISPKKLCCAKKILDNSQVTQFLQKNRKKFERELVDVYVKIISAESVYGKDLACYYTERLLFILFSENEPNLSDVQKLCVLEIIEYLKLNCFSKTKLSTNLRKKLNGFFPLLLQEVMKKREIGKILDLIATAHFHGLTMHLNEVFGNGCLDNFASVLDWKPNERSSSFILFFWKQIFALEKLGSSPKSLHLLRKTVAYFLREGKPRFAIECLSVCAPNLSESSPKLIHEVCLSLMKLDDRAFDACAPFIVSAVSVHIKNASQQTFKTCCLIVYRSMKNLPEIEQKALFETMELSADTIGKKKCLRMCAKKRLTLWVEKRAGFKKTASSDMEMLELFQSYGFSDLKFTQNMIQKLCESKNKALTIFALNILKKILMIKGDHSFILPSYLLIVKASISLYPDLINDLISNPVFHQKIMSIADQEICPQIHEVILTCYRCEKEMVAEAYLEYFLFYRSSFSDEFCFAFSCSFLNLISKRVTPSLFSKMVSQSRQIQTFLMMDRKSYLKKLVDLALALPKKTSKKIEEQLCKIGGALLIEEIDQLRLISFSIKLCQDSKTCELGLDLLHKSLEISRKVDKRFLSNFEGIFTNFVKTGNPRTLARASQIFDCLIQHNSSCSDWPARFGYKFTIALCKAGIHIAVQEISKLKEDENQKRLASNLTLHAFSFAKNYSKYFRLRTFSQKIGFLSLLYQLSYCFDMLGLDSENYLFLEVIHDIKQVYLKDFGLEFLISESILGLVKSHPQLMEKQAEISEKIVMDFYEPLQFYLHPSQKQNKDEIKKANKLVYQMAYQVVVSGNIKCLSWLKGRIDGLSVGLECSESLKGNLTKQLLNIGVCENFQNSEINFYSQDYLSNITTICSALLKDKNLSFVAFKR